MHTALLLAQALDVAQLESEFNTKFEVGLAFLAFLGTTFGFFLGRVNGRVEASGQQGKIDSILDIAAMFRGGLDASEQAQLGQLMAKGVSAKISNIRS